ncbi:MAG: hypothetical protein P0116_03240 [Candidatus Nitrosocosmicus sp.]|nr:hypothetical protein [Candidatus Nitrosocosmicus sp.]
MSCGYDPKKEVRMGIDFAVSSLWDNNKKVYDYKTRRHKNNRGTIEIQ